MDTSSQPHSANSETKQVGLHWTGLFPAAGYANRLGTPRMSKEILPVADWFDRAGKTIAVGDYLMHQLAQAAIDDVLIIRRVEKTDIAEHYRQRFISSDGHSIAIRHACIAPTRSLIDTLCAARDHYHDRHVVLGFPDIILSPLNAVKTLTDTFAEWRCDLLLGLFPVDEPERCDTVELAGNRVARIHVKSPLTQLQHAWCLAAWSPATSSRIFASCKSFSAEVHSIRASSAELYPGHLFQQLIEDGLDVRAITFADGFAHDIGTPGGLQKAQHPMRQNR